MKQIHVTFNIDETAIMNESGQANLDDVISQELGWLHNSGISVESWSFAPPAKEQDPPPVNKIDNRINRRIDALRNYRENEDLMRRAAEERKRDEENTLVARIKSLEPRIKELIATGNACLQSNIPLTGQAFGMRESYDTNQFFTNSWSHLVGFVGNPNSTSCYIEFLGINGGGACGAYDFRTDGDSVFSVNENNHTDIIPASIGHMKRFLENFDTFEKSFYAYVDKTIEMQQKSVDALISSAQEKASIQKSSVNRDLHNIER